MQLSMQLLVIKCIFLKFYNEPFIYFFLRWDFLSEILEGNVFFPVTLHAILACILHICTRYCYVIDL